MANVKCRSIWPSGGQVDNLFQYIGCVQLPVELSLIKKKRESNLTFRHGKNDVEIRNIYSFYKIDRIFCSIILNTSSQYQLNVITFDSMHICIYEFFVRNFVIMCILMKDSNELNEKKKLLMNMKKK